MNNTMHRFAAYDDAGNIVQVLEGAYRYAACTDDVADNTHYINTATGIVEPKVPFEYEIATSGLSIVINGLPEGVSVMSRGLFIVTDEASTTIEFDVPGAYTVELSGHIEHVDESLEVTVGDP